MHLYNINFTQATNAAPDDVEAAWFQIENGFFYFKDDKGTILAAYACQEIASVVMKK